MPTLADAAMAGFEKAREIYTGKDLNKKPIPTMPQRFKSSNKRYFTGPREEDPADPADITRFNRAEALHAKDRIAFKIEGGKVFDIGRTVRLSRANALNCLELASIAAEWAHCQLGKPKPAPIAIAWFEPPGDHCFCVVAPPSSLNNLQGDCVTDLSTDFLNHDAWVADPWLNILCHLSNYGSAAKAQLHRWQLNNKRIAWATGPRGPGWYMPLGDYEKAFLTTKLNVSMAS
jgi:hypothetical protein